MGRHIAHLFVSDFIVIVVFVVSLRHPTDEFKFSRLLSHEHTEKGLMVSEINETAGTEDKEEEEVTSKKRSSPFTHAQTRGQKKVQCNIKGIVYRACMIHHKRRNEPEWC